MSDSSVKHLMAQCTDYHTAAGDPGAHPWGCMYSNRTRLAKFRRSVTDSLTKIHAVNWRALLDGVYSLAGSIV